MFKIARSMLASRGMAQFVANSRRSLSSYCPRCMSTVNRTRLWGPQMPVISLKPTAWFSSKQAGDLQISDFLKEEIELEGSRSMDDLKITGFDISTDGTFLTLSRTFDDEKITVKLNVNGSVQDMTDYSPNETSDDETVPDAKMESRPTFMVEIARGTAGEPSLSFQCRMTPPFEGRVVDDAERPPDMDEINDRFEIEDIAFMRENDDLGNEKSYTLDGDVMDPNLYDLLMNMLDERGINNEFVNELCAYCTNYEHNAYVQFLGKLRDFVAKS